MMDFKSDRLLVPNFLKTAHCQLPIAHCQLILLSSLSTQHFLSQHFFFASLMDILNLKLEKYITISCEIWR